LIGSYEGLLDPRGSKLALLKSTFNADNFIPRSSLSISSDFDKFTLELCVAASNREKHSLKTLFWGSRSFKVIDVNTTGKLVSSVCYDVKQVCLSATVLLLDWTTVAETARFEGGTQI